MTQWLHNIVWILAVLAVACALGAAYVIDVKDNGTVAGILALAALGLGGQAYRVKRWVRRMEEAKPA